MNEECLFSTRAFIVLRHAEIQHPVKEKGEWNEMEWICQLYIVHGLYMWWMINLPILNYVKLPVNWSVKLTHSFRVLRLPGRARYPWMLSNSTHREREGEGQKYIYIYINSLSKSKPLHLSLQLQTSCNVLFSSPPPPLLPPKFHPILLHASHSTPFHPRWEYSIQWMFRVRWSCNKCIAMGGWIVICICTCTWIYTCIEIWDVNVALPATAGHCQSTLSSWLWLLFCLSSDVENSQHWKNVSIPQPTTPPSSLVMDEKVLDC